MHTHEEVFMERWEVETLNALDHTYQLLHNMLCMYEKHVSGIQNRPGNRLLVDGRGLWK